MDFKVWLENNWIKSDGIKIPILQKHGEYIKYASGEELNSIIYNILKNNYNQFDPKGFQYFKSRYKIEVEGFRDHWSGLTININILSNNRKKNQSKIPQDAIEKIPQDPNLAYRGMSWEEWQFIRNSKFIQSHGNYNLGDEQVGLTLFSPKADTGEFYGHAFAPYQNKAAIKKPAVVIAVPKDMLLTHKDDPKGIPESELAYKGPLPIKYIKHAWMLIPTRNNKKDNIDLKIPWTPAWKDEEKVWNGEKFEEPSMDMIKLNINKATLGSYSLSGARNLVIRKMF